MWRAYLFSYITIANYVQPGVAMLHDAYGIYHLTRKATGRTPASTASYMAFAAAFDASLIPFFAFSAYESAMQYKMIQGSTTASGQWTTLLPQGTTIMSTLTGAAFLATTITGGLHLISLALNIYLCMVFRRILNLPPDMNPLEDHLTARPHKRNKSELSNLSTSTLAEPEKRISLPLENRRNSGAPYEDLSRPPSIPFLHTRTGSTDSFGTYHSRDSRHDLPKRQYQIAPSNTSSSSLPLKRASFNADTPPTSPLKQAAYAEIPLDDRPLSHPLREAWFKADAVATTDNPYPVFGNRTPSPKKTGGAYAPLHQQSSSADLSETFPSAHPNPLAQNPSPRIKQGPTHHRGTSYDPQFSPAQGKTPRQARPQTYSGQNQSPSRSPVRDVLAGQPNAFQAAPQNLYSHSPKTTPTKMLPNPFTKSLTSPHSASFANSDLTPVANNRTGRPLTDVPSTTQNMRQPSSTYSSDLADASVSDVSSVSSYNRNSVLDYNLTSKSSSSTLRSPNRTRNINSVQERVNGYENSNRSAHKKTYSFSSEVSAQSVSNPVTKLKTKAYDELRAATPPVLLGPSGDLGSRQVSSGTDWRGKGRDVSGKVAEEGRGGVTSPGTWGTRFRKVSGIGGQ